MRTEKLDFALIEAIVLTIGMHRAVGTRGNFNIVLPVRFPGAVSLIARYQGRPHRPVMPGVSASAAEQPPLPSRGN